MKHLLLLLIVCYGCAHHSNVSYVHVNEAKHAAETASFVSVPAGPIFVVGFDKLIDICQNHEDFCYKDGRIYVHNALKPEAFCRKITIGYLHKIEVKIWGGMKLPAHVYTDAVLLSQKLCIKPYEDTRYIQLTSHSGY